MNNTEKAERLRKIAGMLDPEFQHDEAVFLELLADEESKPLELDADKAEGLSLRDHFAANAINGMIAGYDPQSKANGRFVPENDYPLLAEQSYQIADAMLNERTKKQSPLEMSSFRSSSFVPPNASKSMKALCWKLDRDIWAKVEAKEATTSWGREQSAIAICEAICDNGIGKCMKEQESQEELWGKALLIADMAQFRINHDGSCDYSEAISEIKKAGFTITKSNP